MSSLLTGKTEGAAVGDAPRPGLLQRKCACGGQASAGAGECEQCRRGLRLQASLAVGSSHDPLEQEADRVADQIVRAGVGPAAIASVSNVMQRDAPGESGGGKEAPDSVHQALSTAGSALEPPVRQDMEGRFGHDFSRVRVHTDAIANRSANAVNAAAYTVGQDIAFARGQYAPATSSGRRLLAHELTHVVQQEGGSAAPRVMRDEPKPKPPTKIDFGKEDEEPKAKPDATAEVTQKAGKGAAEDATLFFQDPKVASDPKEPERNRVFVESQLTTVGTVRLRFAYPASEMSSGTPSGQITRAKQQIGDLIAEVIRDLGSYQFASAKEETTIGTQRTRLGQAFREGTASKPINIFIATMESKVELATGKYIPYTDRVYINAKDVGDRAKLEGAIRVPLQNLVGGHSIAQRKDVPAADRSALKDMILHESLHAMLIAQQAGSDAQWEKLMASKKFSVTGPQAPQAKAEELLRKFLIAQEEHFAYTNVGSLYPPVNPIAGSFETFIKLVEQFIKKRGGAVTVAKQKIAVTERFQRRDVSWDIEFRLPSSLAVVDKDVEVMDVLLAAYPNSFR